MTATHPGDTALEDSAYSILDTAREFVREHALPPMDETPIRLAALGPDAGMIGAALLGRIGLEGHV